MNNDVSFSSSSTSSSSSSGTDHERSDPVNVLPQEILDIIFSNISNVECAEARTVCKEWSQVIDPTSYPHITPYGVNEWKKFLGYTVEGEVPAIPGKIIETVEMIRCQLKGEDEAPACSLILMPKGLTFNKLRPLIENEHLEKNNRTSIEYIWEEFVEEHEDKAVDESYWFLITENVIEGSRGKSYDQQKALIEESTNSQCALPRFLEVMACIALKRAKTGKRIFSDYLDTYTRCEEKAGRNRSPVIVGSFSSSGLIVDNGLYPFNNDGVAACRKF